MNKKEKLEYERKLKEARKKYPTVPKVDKETWLPKFHWWDEVPENLKTKTQWRKEHFKVINENEIEAIIEYHAGTKLTRYKLYEKSNTKTTRRIIIKIDDIEPTDKNLSEALYLINKSAKKSRDTKGRNYSSGNHRVVHAAKTRQQKLYDLKDAVIAKLISENRMELLGYHTQDIKHEQENEVWVGDPEGESKYNSDKMSGKLDYQFCGDYDNCDFMYGGHYEIINETVYDVNYLLLYQFGDNTFHVPVDNVGEGIKNLGEIGIIDAEQTKKYHIKFTEAVKLLENYIESHKENKLQEASEQ
ncbi:hypothetical protein ABNN70_10495 [Sporolactobacillus sp. Y61]|jgi:hypothetical protein|uniref:Large polyvalent protein associated domain-containing protein n=1 Tax=Sporolactobacillus sp. Y61 TaxID=3160863 RepID=A0AAU8ICN2_9BACL|nr:hypothetical protein [Sporolactobacillus sp. THM19-2]RYL92226.1 hypothetical protein EWH91_08345 [Sporolactobacillus sp. THM19-2]